MLEPEVFLNELKAIVQADKPKPKKTILKKENGVIMMKSIYEKSVRGIGNELKVQHCFPGHLIFSLWSLWELVITETPLLVVGSHPKECSHAIIALLSLISPLATTADIRPYSTVLNDDISEYQQALEKGILPNVILGVSNPLLAKNFKKFPAILRLDN